MGDEARRRYLMTNIGTLFSGMRNRWRVAMLRFQGADVDRSAIIGRGVQVSGKVRIGERTNIGNGVSIRGNVSIGKRCSIAVGVEINGNIDIGDETAIGNYTTLSTLPAQGHLNIGSDVYVNSFSVIGSSQSVQIKDHCIFAPFIQLGDGTHRIDDPRLLTKHAPFGGAPVVIEENVWLGSGVMIMMGVTIGAGSVIGAKALVNSNIPPYSIAFGIPARVVRSRLQDPGETE